MRSIFFILFIFCAQIVRAQSSKINIAISRDTVLLGNSFYVQYSFEMTNGKLIIPEWIDMLLIGSGQMSSTSIINGEIKTLFNQHYLLKPNKTGDLIIPATKWIRLSEEILIPEVYIYVKSNPDHLEIEPQDDNAWKYNLLPATDNGIIKRKAKKL